VGCVVLAGFGDWLPGSAIMKPNTALGMVCAGLSLCVGATGRVTQTGFFRRLMEASAGIAALVGVLTLFEYLLGLDFGIDHLMAAPPPELAAVAYPGRMAPTTATTLMLVGIALLWEADTRHHPRLAHVVALVAALGAFLSLLGYAYELEAFYALSAYPRMSLHAALTFCVLSCGILLLRPGAGLMGVLTSDSAGGVMARRLLPATIVVPVGLGWLRLVGERAGLYGAEFGLSLNVVGNVAVCIAVVAWTVRSLHRTDRERRRAQEALGASEQRYRQLTEASLDAIVVADAEGRVVLFNPSAERVFGYTSAEVEGQPITCLMPPEFHDRHRTGLRRFVETREAHVVGQTVELRGLRKNGAQFPLELSLGAVEIAGKVQFVGAMRDLTERHRMRSAMVQSEKLASIGLLSAGVAHEINNPLAYVANNLAVLERDAHNLMSMLDAYEAGRAQLATVDPERAALVQRLADEMDVDYVRGNLDRLLTSTREGVQRVTRIVQAMRGMARSGPMQMESVRLAELVDMSLELVRGRIERRGIAVELDCAATPTLRCAASQLSQVLLNLVVNALQAVEAAGRGEDGRIRVSSHASRSEMLIEVTDNGCGIAPQDLPHIFDPFFTTKEVGEGTGLGLAISHGIIEAHGGRIEASSEPGSGSCFRVFLPLGETGGIA
jgi:PAS domain S-box-containing protein